MADSKSTRAASPVTRRAAVNARAVALVALSTVVGALLVTGTGAAAQAAPLTCPPGNIWFNTGDVTPALYNYSSTGTLVSSVPLARGYGDIGFSSDGQTLYGVDFGSPTIYTIDTQTGAESAATPLTGVTDGGNDLNALSALPDGKLLVGSNTTNTVYEVDPASGSATVYVASFPATYVSAGDFLSLPGGDVLALASGGGTNDSTLFRFRGATAIDVGTVPSVWGAAQSGGNVYLATSDGRILQLDAIPTQQSTTAVGYSTTAANVPSFWGATSQQDSGLCAQLTVGKTANPASGTVLSPGQTVTYTVTLSNVDGTAPANVDETDNLADVLDDATLTSAPVVTSGAGVTVSTAASGSFRLTGTVPVGGTVTVSYRVTVNDPDRGNLSMSNYVFATGTTPPVTCAVGAMNCTVHPVTDPSVTSVTTSAQLNTTGTTSTGTSSARTVTAASADVPGAPASLPATGGTVPVMTILLGFGLLVLGVAAVGVPALVGRRRKA